MSKNQEYIQQYAEYAMEQMRRYGIPASVTLAQGICESASGQSELSRKGNNHFGIKATSSWIENGGGSKLPPAGLRMEANILYIPMTVQTKSFASMRMWEIPMSIILSS